MYQINLAKHRVVPIGNTYLWDVFLFLNGAFLVFFLLLSGYEVFSYYLENRALHRLMVEKQEAKEKLQEQLASLPNPVQKDLLNKRLKELEEQVALKKNFLGLFSIERLGNRDGFSKYLLALSKEWLEGIWLVSLEIKDGGKNISMQGNANDGTALPELLEKLKNQKAFAGVSFKNFKMNQDPSKKYLNYVVQSDSIAGRSP